VGKGQCRVCHAGPNFTDGEFHDLGIPSGPGLVPDAGRASGIATLLSDEFQAGGAFSDDTQSEAARATAFLDPHAPARGQVKTPSLRNVALTAPYMHQGQMKTLRDVVRFYSTHEGRAPAGPHDEKVLVPLHLEEGEIDDLVAFLESLTGAPLPPELLQRPPAPR
jgi:cytochrome c peroxidase